MCCSSVIQLDYLHLFKGDPTACIMKMYGLNGSIFSDLHLINIGHLCKGLRVIYNRKIF
jgi:hypothetical protein